MYKDHYCHSCKGDTLACRQTASLSMQGSVVQNTYYFFSLLEVSPCYFSQPCIDYLAILAPCIDMYPRTCSGAFTVLNNIMAKHWVWRSCGMPLLECGRSHVTNVYHSDFTEGTCFTHKPKIMHVSFRSAAFSQTCYICSLGSAPCMIFFSPN